MEVANLCAAMDTLIDQDEKWLYGVKFSTNTKMSNCHQYKTTLLRQKYEKRNRKDTKV